MPSKRCHWDIHIIPKKLGVVWCVKLCITTIRICSYGLQGLGKGQHNNMFQRSIGLTYCGRRGGSPRCWVVFAVPVRATNVGTDVVTSRVSPIRFVVALSEKRLRTIGFHVEPSLLGGPPLLDQSSVAPKRSLLRGCWPCLLQISITNL
jgi:hypothetical protein